MGIVQVSDRLDSVATSFTRLARYLLLVPAAALVLGVVVGFILALHLEKPIVAVTTCRFRNSRWTAHRPHPRKWNPRNPGIGSLRQLSRRPTAPIRRDAAALFSQYRA
ncbi:MAG: hypothetical protein M5U34_43480 [Chloroflexi bacterium]|nr:hypothetical protein [Chloroflexota bacterium]